MPQDSIHKKATIQNDLQKLGLQSGDGVFVHASLSGIGMVVGGARSVVEALIETVGESGLVAMPGFSMDAYEPSGFDRTALSEIRLQEIRDSVLGFDIETSPTVDMGAIAETFRTWPGTKRSNHPCVSICARGLDVDIYLATHSLAWGTGPDTPLGAFRSRPNMKMLLIGVGWNRCSALHTAETLAPNRRTKTRDFKNSSNGKSEWIQTPDVADDLNRLFPPVGAAFEAEGNVTIGRIGMAETRICGYADLIEFATPWLAEAIQKENV